MRSEYSSEKFIEPFSGELQIANIGPHQVLRVHISL